jgi:hypothetical protein
MLETISTLLLLMKLEMEMIDIFCLTSLFTPNFLTKKGYLLTIFVVKNILINVQIHPKDNIIHIFHKQAK